MAAGHDFTLPITGNPDELHQDAARFFEGRDNCLSEIRGILSRLPTTGPMDQALLDALDGMVAGAVTFNRIGAELQVAA